MSSNSTIPAIDADGHFLERSQDIFPYLDDQWRGKTELWPGDQPWATEMEATEPPPYDYDYGLSPSAQIDIWHRALDEHEMAGAALFSSMGAASVCTIQQPEYAIASARACNRHFAEEFSSERLKPMGVLPMRDPQAAADEVRYAAGELGIVGFEVMPIGLPFGLGDPFYDPIFEAAVEHEAAICIHGTRLAFHEFGGDKLRNFSEIHAYAFPAGVILHFTSVISQGLTIRFPGLRLAFLEIGCTWLPYYLDRLDEHYEKRGSLDMNRLDKNPSDVFRDSGIKVSLEGKESMLAHTVDFVGAEHLVYATDLPHWDAEFPENLHDIRNAEDLSPGVKEHLLYSNAKELFRI